MVFDHFSNSMIFLYMEFIQSFSTFSRLCKAHGNPAKSAYIKTKCAYLFNIGVFSFFLSNCCLLATNNTAGEGSRQRGSSVANSNLLSSWNMSSWVQTWPSLVMLLISHIRD